MKTVKIIAIALILGFSSLTTFAGGPDAVGNPNNLRKHILQKIDYPDFARSLGVEGSVLVSFEVNKDGFINIVEINASDAILKNHVITKLRSIRLCPFDVNAGQVHNMKFNFHLKV